MWQLALAAAALAFYAYVSHLLMLHAAGEPWAVLVIFGPLLLAVFGVALRKRHAPSMLTAAALAAVLVGVTVLGGVGNVQRLYVLQHIGLHLALGWGFGITLRPGSTPLISAMAAPLHSEFPPAMQAYTRRLTALWTGYFCVMALLSLLIYAFLPWSAWSLFANLLSPVFALIFFLAEHPLRYWLHPEFERRTIGQAMQAWRAHSAQRASRQAP
jgi:uncharacterized membrane protein